MLDRALVLVFPGPRSATGEDLVELHCHGGRAVVTAVEAALFDLPQVRRAQPGEFTRRALLNGRIDLTEAEGLADLLEAETETQRRAAMAVAEGRVGRAIRGWMERLTILSARIEASIDYAEEGDVEAETAALEGLAGEQTQLAEDIATVLAHPPVERWRDGIRLVIAGPPNAGKSTLLNALAERDASIASPFAGTTRDRIEVSVRRNGIGYVLIDTAGLHDASEDLIEQEGMARARAALAEADLLLWMDDAASPYRTRTIHLHARADLPGRSEPGPGTVPVSIKDGRTVHQLWVMIEKQVASLRPHQATPLHQREWSACAAAAAMLADPAEDPLLQAEQLRSARKLLAEVLGMDATDVMLDALFSRFCVGK